MMPHLTDEERIAELERQLDESERKAAALDWLEQELRDTGRVDLEYFDRTGDFLVYSDSGMCNKNQITLLEAIESLRQQVEQETKEG